MMGFEDSMRTGRLLLTSFNFMIPAAPLLLSIGRIQGIEPPQSSTCTMMILPYFTYSISLSILSSATAGRMPFCGRIKV